MKAVPWQEGGFMIQMRVPAATVSPMIGKNGADINKMRAETGAQFCYYEMLSEFSDEAVVDAWGQVISHDSGFKVMTIAGTPTQVIKAIITIVCRTQEILWMLYQKVQ